MSNVVEQIVLFQKKLDKYSATNETDKLLYYIHKLKQLNIRVSHLEVTGVGRTVNALRQQHKGIVADKAKALVNKWKDLLTEEDEEEEYEAEEEEEEEYDGHQPGPAHPVPHVPEARDYATEDQESDNGGEEEEEEDDGRLQIEEDQDYPDNHYGYSPTETKTNRGYSYQPQQHDDSDSGQEDSYNPLTSQRDYLRQSGPVTNEYHPSSCSRVDSPDAPSSPQWKDASPTESSDRKNGTSPRASSSKKSSKGNKERSKDKERHKDKGKESSRSHEKEKKKERKEKHKHRDKEEKKEEKKSHKDKHREKDKHSEKVKEKKRKSEDYNEKPPQLDTPDERYMANGFSSPEVEERSYSNKKELRESDKREMDEKRKAKSDKSISIASKKDDSSHRDNNTSSVHKENRLSDDREGDRTAKYSGREKENIGSSSSGSGSKDKGREKKREERHRDKDRSKSDKKERHSKESEDRKLVNDKSKSSSSKDKVKKKSKAEEDIGFGAALMGLDSPVKKKKKKKKKEAERERESSDDEKPSTSSSSNKRVLADDGEQSSPKKPKLLALSPHKLPKLPSFVQDDAPFLPEITPNYKPLPRVAVRDEVDSSLAKMTDEEALNFMFQSKNKKRSKMYSGKASGLSYVPSLYEICIRVLQDNIDALEATGGIPFDILRPVLERADPRQLMALEDYNSYLLEDTNVLWEVHCKRDFRNKRLEEMETWRDMWIRMSEERDHKLKSITENLQKKFVSNSEPKRTTKLAFVNTIAKVPKSVARAQAKYGTAPTSAAAKIAAAKPTKANEAAARKTTLLNVQRAERATNPRPTAAKKRVAPLMAKTRQFYKKAFRR